MLKKKKNDLIIQIRSGDGGLDRGRGSGQREGEGEGCRQEDVQCVKALATLGGSLQCDNGHKRLAFVHLLSINDVEEQRVRVALCISQRN